MITILGEPAPQGDISGTFLAFGVILPMGTSKNYVTARGRGGNDIFTYLHVYFEGKGYLINSYVTADTRFDNFKNFLASLVRYEITRTKSMDQSPHLSILPKIF